MGKKNDDDQSKLVPLRVIRTETVLSRLPVHNLSKRGPIEVRIVKRDKGEVALQWTVSYSNDFGQPGQLAYKVDTLIVNRKVDEERRPLPKRIRLGSLTEICHELDLADSGKNRAAVKQALQQNATAFINAKLSYKDTEGEARWLDALFNRYNVVFTGERLPDGKVADAVYLFFSEPFHQVLSHAPVRPQDYDYLRQLTPTAQRFYEIISYRIFATLQNDGATARLPYSEYCTFALQPRHDTYDAVKKQMYKIHKPHLDSGYLADVDFESFEDDEGRSDWMMIYVPGPKAIAEYETFSQRKVRRPALAAKPVKANASRQHSQSPGAPLEEDAQALVDELAAQGLAKPWATDHVRGLDREQRERARHIVDYFQALRPKRRWDNPPGMLRSLLEMGRTEPIHIPDNVPSREAARVADNARTAREDAVEQEALAFLAEARRLDRLVDEHLANLDASGREDLRRRAREEASRIQGFSNWSEAAQARQVDYLERKIALADASAPK